MNEIQHFHQLLTQKSAVFWVVPCSLVKFTNISEVLAASIRAMMMEAASTSETSVNFHQTMDQPPRRQPSYLPA
jgi:hypothetical protein